MIELPMTPDEVARALEVARNRRKRTAALAKLFYISKAQLREYAYAGKRREQNRLRVARYREKKKNAE